MVFLLNFIKLTFDLLTKINQKLIKKKTTKIGFFVKFF